MPKSRTISIAGAGPAGLTAAINLARAGYEVVVHEQHPDVGMRISEDFQVIENWSSGDDPLHTSTILPVTPPFPNNSCACLASARGKRWATSGLILCWWRRSSSAIKSCRNHAGFSLLSHWMV